MADPLAIAVRLGLFLVLGLLFGLPAFVLMLLRDDPRALRLGSIVPLLALVAALLSLAQVVLLAASMSGSDLASVDKTMVDAVLTAGSLGVAWKARMIALALGLVAGLGYPRRPGPALALGSLAGAIALGSLAWTGHGTMGDDAAGWLHLGADLLHLGAAGLWLGALVGLVILVAHPTQPALCARALSGFAHIGTAIVVTLAITGLVNVWILVGPSAIGGLVTTVYGWLLAGKISLFAAMLGLAAANRFRLGPALTRSPAGESGPAIRNLRISLAIETGCILAILLLVAWLGTLPPTGDA
ncbi:copper homeostasis membrane protein CopD [Sphingomonas sp. MMS24-J13]|uniref:copper homeostasis membrane protein CopD n=1 Tax=Sphingomonas sp. MMS24-J13 TaxID=3238686 RepID=UPI00384E099B